MLTLVQWKKLAHDKVATARRLIDAGEYAVAAEQMGYALECALKAVACKTMRLEGYPPVKGKQEIAYFKSHEFDALVLFSGMSDLFTNQPGAWSQFTFAYSGQWTEMRYEPDVQEKFHEQFVKDLLSK